MANILRCDMCQKPLKGARFKIQTLLGSGELIVGPECFRKEKKARKEMLERHTPEQIEALRAKIAAKRNIGRCDGPNNINYQT